MCVFMNILAHGICKLGRKEFPIAFQRVQWQYGLVYVKKKSISYCKGKLKIRSQWLNWSHLEMTLTGLL